MFSYVSQTDKYRLRSLAVSKPSCAVCWELLSRSDPDAARLGIHSRQNQVYPVELPPWICEADARAMVEIFRKRLCDEISIMMQRQRQLHGRSSSESVASNSTEDMGVTSGERNSQSLRPESFHSVVVNRILNMPLFKRWKKYTK